MTHLEPEAIARYRRRTLPAAELLAADDHLAACAACRSALLGGADPAAVGRAFAGAVEGEHVDYEALEAYVDGSATPDERAAVDEHVATCERCAEELRDLAAFAAAPAEPEPRTEPTNVVAFPRRAPWPVALRAVAAALLVAGVIGLAYVALRQRPGPPTPIAHETPPPPPPVENGPSTEPPPTENPPESAAVELADAGGRVALVGGRVEGLDALSAGERDAVSRALARGAVSVPSDVASLAGRSGVLMGGKHEAGALAVAGPVGTAVRDGRPTLRWRAVAGVARYTVAVYDASFTEVARGDTTSTSWRPDAPLSAGDYTWQVTAHAESGDVVAPAPPAPEARFAVLGAQAVADVAAGERRAGASHLARGVLYARAGLLDDAERELRALADANPGSPEAARLLRSVRRLRGR